ncbi:pentatricopeptide repeat-containing protein At1g01970 [Magnolia sinica]|uniref:pentatricopeptide repeat-containing protein At1g01970 n=1 Tax=Magnolia sinica TaxID=86752 RepID=UPI00265A72EA|nr:pentatricopeptide repeat-containing protein At1g01970 [Magnolia sinica]
MLSHTHPISLIAKTRHHTPWRNSCNSCVLQHHRTFRATKSSFQPTTAPLNGEEKEKEEERPKLRWMKIGPEITDTQKQAISQLPPKMTKRCKALAERVICFCPGDGADLSQLLSTWVKIMKPRRADWLSVLRELKRLEIPLLLEVMEFALVEDSFEANVRDYTKIIDAYAKQNCLQDAENALAAMKSRGFTCDQVTLTVLLHMYSKAGDLTRAEETFAEMKLLGLPLDKRAYGSMIMAYIRAGMAGRGESLIREMEAQDIYAGKEVYKALLRAYSTAGDTGGAERVFDAIQFAGIAPDVKLCALLMNAYRVVGQSHKARSVLENLRRVGLQPSDKCMAVMLGAYEDEGSLNKALSLLIDLEKNGFLIGEEASQILAKWFRRLGIVDEVELVLREYAERK